MPNWKTHLEISNRINQTYKFSGIDFKKFLLGSILPDINNSHIVKDISEKRNHEITHCFEEGIPSYLVFYRRYKNQIDAKDPIFVGYVTHLYTDYTWNNNFYTNIAERNYPEKDKVALRIMKQSDFGAFNNKFKDQCIDVSGDSEFEILLNETKKINEVSVTFEDLSRVVEFLKKQELYDDTLQFYTMEELEELLEETVVCLTKK